MTRSRKVLLVLIALVVLADFLPVTREEFSWWWTQSHDHAGDYLRFLSVWPTGRHAADAKILYRSRNWEETKMANIRQAYQPASAANAVADAAYRREQQSRREFFSWKEASASNTIESYNEYLRQYTKGRFAAQARRQLALLNHPAQSTGPASPQ